MKILNTQQIKLVDFNTIVNLNINSVDLMEKAAGKCLQWIEDQDHIDELNTIHIFCGMGNNGGDGLALGRMLNLEFYDAQVYIVHFSDKMSDDFITNYNRAEEFQIHPISIHSEDDFPEIKETDFIIMPFLERESIKHLQDLLRSSSNISINQKQPLFRSIYLLAYLQTNRF